MGVTIHYEGQLISEDEYKYVIAKAQQFAISNNMSFYLFEEQNEQLSRVKDEQDWDYEGPVKGVKIQPDDNSDPLWLEFDENYYVQDYCKTQFADIEIHIKLIEFFKDIEGHFHKLLIDDEGEFWDTNDKQTLQTHLANCFHAIEEVINENKDLSGPFRLKDGRIVDLME